MLRLLGVVVALTLSCAPHESETPTRTEDPLHGGTVDSTGALPQVFMMRMKFDTGAQFACTATLITSRTLLAAAHCFDPAAGPSGLTALTDVYVQNSSPAPASSSSEWLRIDPSSTRMHPQWSASDRLSYDVAAALLPAPSSVTPSPHHFAALTAGDVGKTMTVAGFGITAAGNTDYGTRRVAQLPLKGLTAKHVQLGDTSDTGICNGDSGGPSFLTGRDGVRRVVGVHSYDSSLSCTDGLDTRVDLFATSFVQQFIRDFEGGPTCFEDGMCASGCATPDVDCVCAADGACNGACPNLLTDPDCPGDCVANGVCATQACPVPDVDCVEELSACTSDAQCVHRLCVDDERRPTPYCSRPCSDGCLAGTECVGAECVQPVGQPGEACGASTYCLEDTVCTGFTGHATSCLETCATGADCESESACVPAQNGVSLCLPTSQPGEPCEDGLTRCLSQTSCTGLVGEAPSCLTTCATSNDCDFGSSCVAAQFGFTVCAKDPVSLPSGEHIDNPAAGCSVSASTALGWVLVVLLRRRRL